MTDAIAIPRNLMLAVDSQGACEDALLAALWLARALPAELEYVHAFPPRPILWGKASQAAEWEAGTEAAAEALREQLTHIAARAPEALLPLAPLHLERLDVVSAHAATRIVARARERESDLLLLGPHTPRPGFDFGGTVRAVLSRAPCPVWIQPRPARVLRHIAVATDLSAHALRALEFGLALGSRLDARVTAVHVFEPPVLGAPEGYSAAPVYVLEDAERSARGSFEEQLGALEASRPGLSHEFVRGGAVDSILALEERFDLVVMGSHGHTGFAAALLGSVTHAVARRIRAPLCVVPDLERRFLH
ncbi:MAG: universal stress protein [Planctomycetes bacterium]|nr:universal stress protein [Planctomycetota bacterium]